VSTFKVGNTITWSLAVTTSAGVAADLGGGNPTATVTLPDGTTQGATVTKPSTGNYVAAYLAVQAGRHRVTWTGSGANSGDLPYDDVADVWPADPRLIIGLADARAALNTATSSRVNDDEIRGYIVTAGIVIEYLAGAASSLTQTKVESRDGGHMAIGLYQMPTTITTVVENGTTLAATDYYLDSAGTLWRGAYRGAGTWSSIGRVVVTYTTGSGVLAENVKLAAAHLVRHWWNQSQQSYRPYMGAIEEPTTTMVAGYAVPNFVVDLLAPSAHNRMPGCA
jgi:hypothetical protein